jgi:hypothetical protein
VESNRTPEKLIAFCAVLAETANVSMAIRGAGLSRAGAYTWRKEEPEFAKAWDEALAIGVESLEDEANRRAFHGVDEAVFHQGEPTGHFQDADGRPCEKSDPGARWVPNVLKRYSDTLAIFLLKAHKPLKYRERYEHTGKDGAPLIAPTIIIGGPVEALPSTADGSQ